MGEVQGASQPVGNGIGPLVAPLSFEPCPSGQGSKLTKIPGKQLNKLADFVRAQADLRTAVGPITVAEKQQRARCSELRPC